MTATIGERLALIREVLGISQQKLSEITNIGLGTIKKNESSTVVPSGHTLLEYAALGFNPGWILTGVGPMTADMNDPITAAIVDHGRVVSASQINHVLSAAVRAVVLRVYKEEGVRLPEQALFDEVIDAYNLIVTQAESHEARMAKLGWLETQLRQRLRESQAAPGTGKREA